MGFEPTRGNPNGLAVHRLNHSATLSYHFLIKTNINQHKLDKIADILCFYNVHWRNICVMCLPANHKCDIIIKFMTNILLCNGNEYLSTILWVQFIYTVESALTGFVMKNEKILIFALNGCSLSLRLGNWFSSWTIVILWVSSIKMSLFQQIVSWRHRQVYIYR